jgi:hypothetical protein
MPCTCLHPSRASSPLPRFLCLIFAPSEFTLLFSSQIPREFAPGPIFAPHPHPPLPGCWPSGLDHGQEQGRLISGWKGRWLLRLGPICRGEAALADVFHADAIGGGTVPMRREYSSAVAGVILCRKRSVFFVHLNPSNTPFYCFFFVRKSRVLLEPHSSWDVGVILQSIISD